MIYIKFNNDIKTIMLNHTLALPNRECGGFLYGNLIRTKEDTICNIDAIYYEKRYGSGSEFTFGCTYIYNAMEFTKRLNQMNLVGTYHSHGLYPAIFSEVDREQLQKYFGPDKVTIIYSPKYDELVGELLDKQGKSHKAKIITR